MLGPSVAHPVVGSEKNLMFWNYPKVGDTILEGR
jgi:hypothetical protein